MTTYTTAQQNKIDYLKGSIRTDDPTVASDSSYVGISDDVLWSILSTVTPTHNPTYTIDTLPDWQFGYVVLLAKKDVYFRLATSNAPFYPLSAEGASLKKDARFDHYMQLVKQAETDYDDALKRYENNSFGEIQSYEQFAQGHYFSLRNFNQAQRPTVTLTISNITAKTMDLDWTPYDVPNGLFAYYGIFIEKTPYIDPYAYYRRRPNTGPKWVFYDIHRTQYRLEDFLEPDTDFYISVLSYDRNGLYGYDEQKVHTLPLV